jgi:short-subunit dehydrogenase
MLWWMITFWPNQLLDSIWNTPIMSPFAILGFFSVTTYFFVLFVQNVLLDLILPTQDLKKKYKAEWALVTGGSSGIGKAIVEKLAGQGLNVVIVSLPDKLLDDFTNEISAKYPNQQFKKVGVNLGMEVSDEYMKPIKEATKGLKVNIVFNNAGFISLGFFHKLPLGRNLANLHCNATSTIPITHHFINEIEQNGQTGLVAFTSSSAGFLPNPLSSMYASTKAFVTMFASSLAAEVRSKGIDVVCVHPSPMDTNFFQGAEAVDALMFFKKHFAASPSIIADVMFSSAGRFVVRDQGFVTIIFHVLLKILDIGFFTEIVSWAAHTQDDYKRAEADQYKKKD